MAKKGKRRRKAKRTRETQAQAGQEESNVIQFPAKGQVVVASEKVAVNDDVGSVDVKADAEERTEERAKKRDDDTVTRRKEEVEAEKAEADSKESAADAKKSDEAPPEELAVRDTLEDAKAEKRESGVAKKDAPEPTAEDPAAENGKKRRKKKGKTTSSAMIRALTNTGEHAAVAEGFFKADAYEAAKTEEEDWSDLAASIEPMSAGAKKAMRWTGVIAIAGVIVIGALLVKWKLIDPQPEALGATRPTELPSLSAAPAEETEEPSAPEVAVAEPASEEEAVAAAEPAPEEAAPAEEAAAPAEEAPAAPAQAAAPAAPAQPAQPAAPAAEQAAAGGGNATALANQAFNLLNRGQNQQAADLAGQAVAADPTNSKGWITLGAARQAMGDADGARAAYQSCVSQGQGRFVSECRLMLRQ